MTLGYKNIGGWAVLAALHLACNPVPPEAAGTNGATDGTGSTTGVDPTTADSSGDPPDPNEPVCGDGVTEMPEECDLGEDNGNGDFCREDCTTNVCGDGYVGPGEACDDGNNDNGDECTNQCGPAGCGNGILEPPGEECDDGKMNSVTGACLPSCQSATCGDQNIQAGEEACDSDNIAGATCATEGFDGGTLFCNENCDGFNTDDCFLCGNMTQESDEDCDGPDLDDNTCMTQGFGDGTLGCTAACDFDTSECNTCPNQMVEGTEECDTDLPPGTTCESVAPGMNFNFGAVTCSGTCTFDTSECSFCGSDSVEGIEVCDGMDLGGADCMSLGGGLPAVEGTPTCNGDCLTYDINNCVYCGDNVIEGSEICEPGNVGGATCGIVLMDGDYTGTLDCGLDCISYDTSMCCIPIGTSCEAGQQCCNGGSCVDQGSPPGSFECEAPPA